MDLAAGETSWEKVKTSACTCSFYDQILVTFPVFADERTFSLAF